MNTASSRASTSSLPKLEGPVGKVPRCLLPSLLYRHECLTKSPDDTCCIPCWLHILQRPCQIHLWNRSTKISLCEIQEFPQPAEQNEPGSRPEDRGGSVVSSTTRSSREWAKSGSWSANRQNLMTPPPKVSPVLSGKRSGVQL